MISGNVLTQRATDIYFGTANPFISVMYVKQGVYIFSGFFQLERGNVVICK
jgi:hypothetical protein